LILAKFGDDQKKQKSSSLWIAMLIVGDDERNVSQSRCGVTVR
jgi:hypothetical protein